MDDVVEIQLQGGVANAGAVVRVGDHVLRPSNPNTPTIHRFLGAIAAWAQTDQALGSVARLIRRLHRAADCFEPSDADTWSDEMADPMVFRQPPAHPATP